MSATSGCQPINTKPPITEPYRTGSYLIYDISSPAEDNFREGSSIGLRASGSHQLDMRPLIDKLKSLAKKVGTGTVHLVDLRQESHAFFNERAVSWFADKDWSNVGRSLEWIQYDEHSQIERLWAVPNANPVQVFCLTQTPAEHVTPSCYCELVVTRDQTCTEEQLTRDLAFCKYHRIPVTDHCMPGVEAEHSFANLCANLASLPRKQVWVHFHCHGGDGRTTTFLTMYDMFCWKKKHPDAEAAFPTVEDFAKRQLDLFNYDLRPSAACDDPSNWKCALARERWKFLAQWRQKLIDNTWEVAAPQRARRAKQAKAAE
jgi:hypothetical protein